VDLARHRRPHPASARPLVTQGPPGEASPAGPAHARVRRGPAASVRRPRPQREHRNPHDPSPADHQAPGIGTVGGGGGGGAPGAGPAPGDRCCGASDGRPVDVCGDRPQYHEHGPPDPGGRPAGHHPLHRILVQAQAPPFGRGLSSSVPKSTPSAGRCESRLWRWRRG
jgi:hypothetical protein